jgi:hypothetical protein
VRSLCTDKRWPRGELNFPAPLFTEKAFPENETLVKSVRDKAQHACPRGSGVARDLEDIGNKIVVAPTILMATHPRVQHRGEPPQFDRSHLVISSRSPTRRSTPDLSRDPVAVRSQ